MAKTKKEEPEGKVFGLKPIEVQMVQNMHDRANSQLFDYFSFIAMERLAYNVNERTQFRIENGKLYITELPETPKPKEEVAVS